MPIQVTAQLHCHADISNVCSNPCTAERLPMFCVSDPNPIWDCLSGEGCSPNSPFYKPITLTKPNLYKYEFVQALHQQINSAAIQATELEGYEAKPLPFSPPVRRVIEHFFWVHSMSIHRLSWQNSVQKLFWILEEYSGYLAVFMERNRFCLSVTGQMLESSKWNRYPHSLCGCSFLI